MAVLEIAPYKPVSGTSGDAVQVANGFQAIEDVVNALDGNNIAAAAQLAITNLTLSQNNVTALRLTGASAGMTLGGDTNLYRAAADSLRTDDMLTVGSQASNGAAVPGVILLSALTTVPTLNSQGGGYLYCDNTGALKFRGASGTVTAVAPA